MFELRDNHPTNAVIKVMGIGGGGGNAVNHMVQSGIDGVEFIVANTDAQCLENLQGRTVLTLGKTVTKGLGAGANPDVGRQAALEDRERIAEVLRGADILFLAAGMGGGTGTGAAPVVAEVAKELNILTVAVVTKPFPFELRRRMMIAEQGIEELRKHVDSLIVVPNEKLLRVYRDMRMSDAFRNADDVLRGAVQGIAELITQRGIINVDFADVRTVMSERGMAMMGTGIARGENRAQTAAQMAIASPLLDDVDLSGARGILVNITANENLGMNEYQEVGDAVQAIASEHATVIIGTVIDNNMDDEIKVTVVATGLGDRIDEQLSIAVSNPEPVVNPDFPRFPHDRRPASELARGQSPRQPQSPGPRGGRERSERDANSTTSGFFDIPSFLRKQAD